ncbi:MAG: hypothetical protein OSJ62_06170 [Lachnospiraceae bacterium]|nr:hypothetical protein [Lachnospiraceae bacterium]
MGKRYLAAVPLYGKVESLMLLEVGVSNRTDRGAIRPYSGLNTPLFCHQKMAKILGIDRSIRLSNFPPKSQQQDTVSPLWLFLPVGRDGKWRAGWVFFMINDFCEELFYLGWDCIVVGMEVCREE